MLLTILIPTYNREKDIDYNLSLLAMFCRKNGLKENLSIIVSDNASPDKTKQVVEKHIQSNVVHIDYYCQNTNIGFESNLLYSLSKATSEWVMLLGDDDFLTEDYLLNCLTEIKRIPTLGCITPNLTAFLPDRHTALYSREENDKNIYYKPGIEACLNNLWRAHQLSGLCFRRQCIYEEYVKRKIHNLYPQIFFVGYSCLKYDSLHLGNFPVHVTIVPQEQKNWNYGDDGLVGDVFNNFKHLGLGRQDRALLEYSFMKRSSWRYLMYSNCGDSGSVNNAIEKIVLGRNTSFMGSYLISKMIIHDGSYTGKKLKLWFYGVALYSITRQLFSRKSIHFS